MRVLILSLAATAMLAAAAWAGDCCAQPRCCDKCGGQLTCKVVCEMEKIKKTVWVVECEPICIASPGCGCGGCKSGCGCGSDCGCEGDCGCGKCDPCEVLRDRPLVKPKCGKMRCCKKLVQKEIVCEVPTYKCVVAPCGCCGGDACGCDVPETTAPKQEKSAIQAAPLPPIFTGLTKE